LPPFFFAASLQRSLFFVSVRLPSFSDRSEKPAAHHGLLQKNPAVVLSGDAEPQECEQNKNQQYDGQYNQISSLLRFVPYACAQRLDCTLNLHLSVRITFRLQEAPEALPEKRFRMCEGNFL
jgi:hypothetical protein